MRESVAKIKTPDQYYGTGADLLCHLTHVPNAASLPNLYHQVSGPPKHMEQQAIEKAFRNITNQLQLLDYLPLETVLLAKKITTCNLLYHDLNDLEGEIHPFLTTYKSPCNRAHVKLAFTIYDDLLSGTGVSIGDLQSIKNAEKISLPLSVLEATHTLKSFWILLYSMLDSEHLLMEAYNKFMACWCSCKMHLTEELRGQGKVALVL